MAISIMISSAKVTDFVSIIHKYDFTKSFSVSVDFGGGYPDFFKRQFHPPRTPTPFHRYGFNYGYSDPFF
jgi:hypothetical protein